MGLFKKDPSKEYVKEHKKVLRLSKKRNDLEKNGGQWENRDKIDKCNKKMSIALAKRDAAQAQLQNPPSVTKNTNVTVNVSRQQNKKSVEFHGHYHAAPKKQGSKSSRKKK